MIYNDYIVQISEIDASLYGGLRIAQTQSIDCESIRMIDMYGPVRHNGVAFHIFYRGFTHALET